MRSQIKLGRIFGIQIGLHYSWFLIAFLIVVSLSSQFHLTNPGWSESLIVAMALATAVLFFVFLLLHELSHSIFAKSQGLPVREITLFALGGVSQIEKNPTTARSEFWMAFVGPLTSAVLGAACLALRLVAGMPNSPGYVMLSWLGYINLGLAAFNMVPGYPLDGGRILRAALWWKSGDVERSTRQAAWVGQAVGGIFIALGIFQFFGGAGFSGLWIAFIGWFLLQAAAESVLQTGLTHALQGLTVAQVMTPDCPVVDGNLDVQKFVEDRLLRTGDRCFIVMDNDGLAGLVTSHEVKTVDRSRWPFMRVFDIMRPLDEIRTVQPGTPLQAALEIMSRENLNQLPVVNNDHVEGVLTRARLLNFLHTRLELQS
jgi:Zn-dependent protease/CBS domain-containing protein